MAVRQKGKRFYVYFKWNGALLETATSAQNEAAAKRIDKAGTHRSQDQQI